MRMGGVSSISTSPLKRSESGSGFFFRLKSFWSLFRRLGGWGVGGGVGLLLWAPSSWEGMVVRGVCIGRFEGLEEVEKGL